MLDRGDQEIYKDKTPELNSHTARYARCAKNRLHSAWNCGDTNNTATEVTALSSNSMKILENIMT